MAKKAPQFNRSAMNTKTATWAQPGRQGGIGKKYPAVDGYSGGRMDAPGAAKSDAIQSMKKSAGPAASQTIPGEKKTSREERKAR